MYRRQDTTVFPLHLAQYLGLEGAGECKLQPIAMQSPSVVSSSVLFKVDTPHHIRFLHSDVEWVDSEIKTLAVIPQIW